MFAIVVIGGKQFRVAVGDVLTIESIEGTVGKKVTFDRVLATWDGKKVKLGTPTVKGAAVEAKVLTQGKGEKIEVRRFKSKVRYRRHRGFRPLVTKIEIISIK